jgi:hypothetical protein
MADYGVAVTWGDAKPGREKKALDLWADSITVNEKAIADGRIASWDAIVFGASATPPAGATRFYGTQEQIEAFIRSEDFQGTVERATLLLQNVGLRRFLTGAALADGFARYAKLVDSL